MSLLIYAIISSLITIHGISIPNKGIYFKELVVLTEPTNILINQNNQIYITYHTNFKNLGVCDHIPKSCTDKDTGTKMRQIGMFKWNKQEGFYKRLPNHFLHLKSHYCKYKQIDFFLDINNNDPTKRTKKFLPASIAFEGVSATGAALYTHFTYANLEDNIDHFQKQY